MYSFKPIHVMVGVDKHLVRLIVVLRLDVDKSQVLWSEILDTHNYQLLAVFLLGN